MKISVEHNFKEAEKWLDGIRLKQLPYATMLALNETKDRCKDAVLTQMLRKLDRPTPFTMSAFDNRAALRATKRKLTSILQVKPIQAKYLYEQFYGGTETDKHIVPGKDMKLNQYGNLPRNASKAKRTFSIGNVVLKRKGKGKNSTLTVVGFFPKSRSYSKRIDFESTVLTAFDRWFERNWEKMFDRAMATAK